MPSLINTARDQFLGAIRRAKAQLPPRGAPLQVLVEDDHSRKLLDSVLEEKEVLAQQLVRELITKPNDGGNDGTMDAIYILMPTSQSVDFIIRDLQEGRYRAACLLFIDALPDPLLQRVAEADQSGRYFSYMEDLFLNFWATEAQAFSLKNPGLFFSLYSPPRNESSARGARERIEEDLRFVAKCIANVCITLNEYPYIRYYLPKNHLPLGGLKPTASTRPPPPAESSARWRTNLARGSEARAYEAVEGDHATKLLAFFVQQALDEKKKGDPDWPKPSDPVRPRGTLLITDRSMDMLAPFIHEFTYQAMANDLLPIIDGTKYTYKFQSSLGAYEDKTAILSDSDTVWTMVRHMHMREAIDKLMADFNKFIQENAVFQGDGAANLNDMKDMLASLPQYQEQREKFSLHLNMAEECMNIFERDKLPLVANVEQNCSTGLTAEGKNPKNLVEEMVPLLDSRDVINPNKVRIVVLYIQHRDGVPEEDRRRLYQHARLSIPEQDAVNGILHMGVRLSRGPGDRDTKKIRQKPADDDYELSRFKPLIKTIIEDQVADKLDPSLFPYVKDYPAAAPAATSLRPQAAPTSLRSAKPSWHRARSGQVTQDNRQRLLVFMAGGMTYSEIREAYQLSSALNKDIIIGSTHTITPRQFVDDLKVLDLGGVGSKAIPNGLPSSRGGGPRSFQEYYDEKYFVKVPPPPQRPTPAAQQPARGGGLRDRLAKPSPAPSYTGSTSTSSSIGGGAPVPEYKGGEKEKKKKFGLFRS